MIFKHFSLEQGVEIRVFWSEIGYYFPGADELLEGLLSYFLWELMLKVINTKNLLSSWNIVCLG